MKLMYTVTNNDNLFNVKEVLKTKLEVSDRLLLKLKSNKRIFLNGSPCNVRDHVNSNDVVEILIDFNEDNNNIVAKEMPLQIIFEDDSMLVINKPAGFPVHPSMLHYEDSISNGVRYYFNSIGLHRKIRPVNRLDKDTSGIVIFAKNEYVQECLVRQMRNNSFMKEYIAFCEGKFEEKSGVINAPIARKAGSIIERCVDENGARAVTHYDVMSENSVFSVVHLILETGRTHQIRVHMSYIGHPIVGDTLYGNASDLISRQALHSCKVTFVHPVTHKKMELRAPLFPDMNDTIGDASLL